MLLKPKIKLNRITDITPDLLARYGIRSLLLDVDNTLSTHHGQMLTDGLPEWLAKMQGCGVRMLVLSNSKEKRVAPFAKKIGLDYISMALKPLPFRFWAALKKAGSHRRDTAIVGDQIFTDVLGGHLAGVKTILLTPILPETSASFRFKRAIERAVIRLYHIQNTEE